MLINFKGFTNSHYTKHVRELCDIAIRDGVKQRDHLDNESMVYFQIDFFMYSFGV